SFFIFPPLSLVRYAIKNSIIFSRSCQSLSSFLHPEFTAYLLIAAKNAKVHEENKYGKPFKSKALGSPENPFSKGFLVVEDNIGR
ncbi:MAG: hypothetical protein MUF15_21760, partial [Acidobacteria bacterium]|nr:hypothetical protein [Acidobacteriota bacterium]